MFRKKFVTLTMLHIDYIDDETPPKTMRNELRINSKDVTAVGRQRQVFGKHEVFGTFVGLRHGMTFVVEETVEEVCRRLRK